MRSRSRGTFRLTDAPSASLKECSAHLRHLFRVLAIAEAISWTLLLSALALRATVGVAAAVTIAGTIHGFVFLSYGATAVLLALHQRWTAWPTVAAIGSAIVPYATIPTELWLARSGRLAGAWRLEESADPADRRWYDGTAALVPAPALGARACSSCWPSRRSSPCCCSSVRPAVAEL